MTGEAPPRQPGAPAAGLVDHFFRHEYGRLVAILTRKVGIGHLDRVEDAVQSALMAALTSWTADGLPVEPGAWLYRVAHNHLLDGLRRHAGRQRILRGVAESLERASTQPSPHFAREIADDTLRMLFVCCDDGMPRDSQLVFALKTLCGFSVSEIALRLFTSEANVYKRLGRARHRLRSIDDAAETPPLDALRSRLPAVHTVLYLLFNEGYLSAHVDQAIRRELCDDAVRLTTILAEHPVMAVPDTFALLALMHFHAARLTARCDAAGDLLLLEEQDRSLWDRERIGMAVAWLARSAAGAVFSRFHAEAGIAAEHCLAASFERTRWREITELYAMLERIEPSPLHTLNRAVAIAEWQGPEAALSIIAAIAPPPWLVGSYLWEAVLADLHRRAGHTAAAERHRARALAAAPTDAVHVLLARRLSR